jgi:apolipoprotein D and lipocalin family protein
LKKLIASALFVLIGAAAVFAFNANGKTPIPPVANVDLPRFMGDWYVIAHIPTFVEKNAYDAIETYELRDDGKVQTTYRQRKGGFDAPVDVMRPVGTVRPGTNNAVWGMQFVWPIKAEYVIVHLDENYTQTIIGRSARDYVWIMARTPQIPEADYTAHVERLKALGYDTAKLRRVPQRPMGTEGVKPQA